MNILRRIFFILLLFVMGCTQVSVTVNGKVQGYYAEAVTSYDTYNGYLVNGSALFQWRTDWSSTNTSHKQGTLPMCDFGVFNTDNQHYRQTCEYKRYLQVTWDTGSRYCLTDVVSWQSVKLGNFVVLEAMPSGEMRCVV